MRLRRMPMRVFRMLFCRRHVALRVVLGCGVMGFRCRLVMLRSFLMRVIDHLFSPLFQLWLDGNQTYAPTPDASGGGPTAPHFGRGLGEVHAVVDAAHPTAGDVVVLTVG